MTIVTKVGVFYVDHMNDDAPEVDSFSRGCYQALSSPPFLRREPGDEARASEGLTIMHLVHVSTCNKISNCCN